jgi:BirA family biotin operon repressor/biotin-[acetyl-CoA-carboxylase] ligase
MSALGRPRLHLRLTDSTNDRARALALAGAPHGTLVTAAEQSEGRGRQGRRWSAPPGSSLLMSLILHSPPSLLPLLSAVAVCEVCQDLGADARIKWPNDIVVERDGRLAKLAGILIEGRPQEGWAVIGVGLNVALSLDQLPAELALTAATLGAGTEEIEPTLELLLAALERRLAEAPDATLAAWRERDALSEREISWSSGGAAPEHGRAQGVDGTGRLVVALSDGARRALDAGEVHLASR